MKSAARELSPGFASTSRSHRKKAAQHRRQRQASRLDGASELTLKPAAIFALLEALLRARNGDFDTRLPATWDGVYGRIADAFNDLVENNSRVAHELDRVGRLVGKEGRITHRAQFHESSGAWGDMLDSINGLITDLVRPTSEMARVIGAVAKGDLTQTMTTEFDGRPLQGEFARTAKLVNSMVEQLGSFSSEVTRVAREVGTEGKLGGQAQVKGVAGTWKDLTESVNSMASNLTGQVRNIADVTISVASGDLSKKITVDVRGEFLQLKDTINTMVDQLRGFASEVTRVAREVGTDGKLGGQAVVPGVAGVWKDLTVNVNGMAANLTAQVRNLAEVTTSIAKGDLTRKITVDVKGEMLELKNTVNTMVDQLNSFASEVTRVAREVGTDGKLGGQAEVRGVAGTWRDLTENVNGMAANLTSQVRNIAQVTTAVATGDLGKKITVDAKGEILQLKETINTMVDQLNSFASEVTRVAREVGTDGKLGGQAEVRGVGGTWKDLTDNVNFMAANLTGQVRNITEVATAIATGDLARKITVDARGEILELKNTLNTMVDRLNSFAAEVTRVAREVGTEGKLGGQADVRGVAGTWKDLTDSVNGMASNLTAQVRNLADVTTAFAKGDLTKKITVDVQGEFLQLKNTVNTMVDQLSSFAAEVTRVAREVGTEGKLGGQADVKGVTGTWKDLTDNVNGMASNLTGQVRNITEVATAIATGDLARKITVDAKGEIFALKNTINIMVDRLNSFAAEVTRVAREVGTEGKLGGQAEVRDVSGTWKDLTDNVNSMAANLTDQVRGIAKVVTAVANGNLQLKLAVEAKGEIAALTETINSMINTLATFADQVTTVAREVGVEGQLGGQANVPGAAGTWKDLTDNVNRLAANLTTQVRAIAEVATAVTKGDLSRTVQVEARGEVEELKNNINEMIRNLKETTQTNSEQDWLKTNIAKFTRVLQGQRDLLEVSKLTLSELAPLVGAQHGIFYVLEQDARQQPVLHMKSTYGFRERKVLTNTLKLGESLVGQAAIEKQRILLTSVPSDYVQINSGLGSAPPLNVIILPVLFEGNPKAVIELASFERFSATHQTFLEQLTESLGIVINTIQASTRTEDLLKQSQSLAGELQAQQEKLQQTNAELGDKARLLEEQKVEVERKNQEVELAKSAMEEKAEQLALTSKYKSEFLSNMSHELRTPLNSLLILAQQLAENRGGNLEAKQVEFARTIQNSGQDLLSLINDILDLSKIESGTVTLDLTNLPFLEVEQQMNRVFRHVMERKGLAFTVERAPTLPATLHTDVKRLFQIVKNLLSNALKFTEHGHVTLRMEVARDGWNRERASLTNADAVIAVSVVDTGIGIPRAKQRIVFEAFQQADGGTARKYGGTGLGLAISRELATLLGGELVLQSDEGKGSIFTLFLPRVCRPAAVVTTGARRIEVVTTSAEGAVPSLAEPALPVETVARIIEAVEDDRADIGPGERALLIIEDDAAFAGVLRDAARTRALKCLVAGTGEAGLQLATQYTPAAISLDLHLPDMSGWAVLGALRADVATRHIPVTVLSVSTAVPAAMAKHFGAFAHQTKPASQPELDSVLDQLLQYTSPANRRLLIVGAAAERDPIVADLAGDDVEIVAARDRKEVHAALRAAPVACVVLAHAPELNNGAGKIIDLLLSEPAWRDLPVVVCVPELPPPEAIAKLKRRGGALNLRLAPSAGALFAETALYLHRDARAMTPAQRQLVAGYAEQIDLAGLKVLVVDDDIRNIFALTSLLEERGLQVLSKDRGEAAIVALQETADVSLVLMDMMMPEVDGYETIRRLRAIERFKTLPIIALTAKAMKGDREKCIAAGASDYLSKPVNTDQLLATLKIWTR